MSEWAIGVDLGRTKTALGLVDPHNRIVARRRFVTSAEHGPASLVERIAQAAQDLEREAPAGARVRALGLCAPGPVDFAGGMIIDPPEMEAIHHTPLRALLSERLGIPVSLDHDAKSAAVGEHAFGAGRGERGLVYIVVGTGVGAGVVIDGAVLRGLSNQAGEVGHITINRSGDLCPCGSRGCIETHLSGPWLARRYQHRRERFGQPGEPVGGEHVTALAQQGDPIALQILDEAGQALGVAVASLAMLLDVELFVVGGGVVRAGDLLLEPARRMVPEYAFRSISSRVRIVGSTLGEDGAILGCAWQARERLGA